MIECLSNPDWINPQIDFLVFLQNIRVSNFDFFDKFFLSITIFGEFWLPTLICAIVYWCIDFKSGIYLFSLAGLNSLITHFFKMLACVYRPWVLSDRIHPSELAVPYAKGYSFPSGHSAMSSSVLGGLAYLIKQKKFLCFALIGLILLIGFSRLWLGVHTPQDVVVGLLTGFVLIFGVKSLIDWAEKNPNRYLYLAIAVNIITILMMVFMAKFNTYRMDYIGGELLVDPTKNIHTTFVVYSYVLGFLNGCFLCRRFFPFNPKEGSLKNRLIRGAVGAVLVIALVQNLLKYIVMNGHSCPADCLILFIAGITLTLIYPLIFRRIEKI